MLQKIQQLIARISLTCVDKEFTVIAEKDKKGGDRVYLQIKYYCKDTKNQEVKEWTSRKWYLSEYMTEDEIIKTAYAAFKACVEHEIMEGFRVDNKILFNPHISYLSLLEISNQEVHRN